jgi:hypothetical protein
MFVYMYSTIMCMYALMGMGITYFSYVSTVSYLLLCMIHTYMYVHTVCMHCTVCIQYMYIHTYIHMIHTYDT